MFVTSVERDNRQYYLTCGKNPKGPGILAIISLGSPQNGDTEINVCDMEVCANMKAARKWYRDQMKTRPWETPLVRDFQFVCKVPDGLGNITGLRTQGGKLIADTESGTPMIVPVKA